MKKQFVAVAMAAAACSSAFADPTFIQPVIDLGTLTTSTVSFSVNQPTANPDGFYTFAHFVVGSGITSIIGSFTHTSSADVSVLEGWNATSQTWVSLGQDTNLADGFSFSGLTTGQQYKLEIIGNAGAGSISGTVQGVAAAVPEPASLALALSGLGVLGLARRRQKGQA